MKKVIFGSIVIIGMLIPLRVNALTGNISMECDKAKLAPGEKTTCRITGTSSEEVSTVSAKIRLGEHLILENVMVNSVWQGDGDGGNIDLYTDSNKVGTFPIATFVVKADSTEGDTDIALHSIYFSDATFNQFSVSGMRRKVTVAKPTENIPESKPGNNSGSNNGGNSGNNSGNNAGNNTGTQTPIQKSNDANLKKLTINVDGFSFQENQTEYHLEVDYNKTNLEIDAETKSDKATIALPSDFNLKVGNNSFEIKVVAEDGTTKVYRLNVNRLERKLSSNCFLKELKIEKYSIEFQKEITSYTLEKVNESSLNLDIQTEDENATYEVYGNQNLKNQDVVVIRVIAEDGSVGEYTIYIKESNARKNTSIWVSILILCLLISLFVNFLQWWKKRKQELLMR